jgi:hypothetical protein
MEETIQKVITQPSVELSTDSKGKVKVVVKAYGESIKESAEDAQEVFDQLLIKYANNMP